MKYLSLLAIVLSVVSLGYSYMLQRRADVLDLRANSLGSTILTTATSDTLETFRTNVNSSLSSLQNDKVGTTTAQTFTVLQQFSNASSTNFSALLAAFGTTATTTITSAGKVGIASTTPLGSLGIGTAGATSTLSAGKFCMFAQDEVGVGYWIRFKANAANNQPFATSTTPCN